MDFKDSTRPSEDASHTVAGVEGKLIEGKLNLNQDANAPNEKSPATNLPPQISRHKSPATNLRQPATAYESSCRVKPNFGGSH